MLLKWFIHAMILFSWMVHVEGRPIPNPKPKPILNFLLGTLGSAALNTAGHFIRNLGSSLGTSVGTSVGNFGTSLGTSLGTSVGNFGNLGTSNQCVVTPEQYQYMVSYIRYLDQTITNLKTQLNQETQNQVAQNQVTQ